MPWIECGFVRTVPLVLAKDLLVVLAGFQTSRELLSVMWRDDGATDTRGRA